jgi:hypothetical protein
VKGTQHRVTRNTLLFVNGRRKETTWWSYLYSIRAQLDSLVRGRWWWSNSHKYYESVLLIQICTCCKYTQLALTVLYLRFWWSKKYKYVLLCRVHAIFRLRLIFTYAAFWTCASSLSLTPTLSYLLPCLGFLFGTQDHYCMGLRPGNFSWKFCLAFLFLNSVLGPGGVPGHHCPPTWRPRGTVSLSLLVFFSGRGLYPFVTWTPRRILLRGFCFCFSLAVTRPNFSLHYFIWFCIILCFLESFISLHLVVTYICHSCCICFSFVKNIHFLCCWFNGFSLWFVPHLEGSFPLLDPRPVTVHKKAQSWAHYDSTTRWVGTSLLLNIKGVWH